MSSGCRYLLVREAAGAAEICGGRTTPSGARARHYAALCAGTNFAPAPGPRAGAQAVRACRLPLSCASRRAAPREGLARSRAASACASLRAAPREGPARARCASCAFFLYYVARSVQARRGDPVGADRGAPRGSAVCRLWRLHYAGVGARVLPSRTARALSPHPPAPGGTCIPGAPRVGSVWHRQAERRGGAAPLVKWVQAPSGAGGCRRS